MITYDTHKGAAAARLLHDKFASTGVFGRSSNPEDPLPQGMDPGSLEHLLFLTLTVSLDYQRNASALWSSARQTYEDTSTHYLFSPSLLSTTSFEQIRADLQKYRLALRPEKDALVWGSLGETLHECWDDDPLRLLAACEWSAPRILKHLKKSKERKRGHNVFSYPHLRGAKLGPLWLRMLWDTAGVAALKDLDQVPMPVDIHVARASLALGVVRGEFVGRLDKLFHAIQQVWFGSVRGMRVGTRGMMALDINRPLWHLSKHGCSKRDPHTGTCSACEQCDVSTLCAPGIIHISKSYIRMRT